MDCSLRLCLRIWSFIWPDSVVRSTVRYCISYGCVNRSNKPECSKLSLHSLPLNNAKLLQTWLLKMNRKDLPASNHSYLCSQYFSEDYFIRSRGKRYLKCGSPEESQSGKLYYPGWFITGLHVRQQSVKSKMKLH